MNLKVKIFLTILATVCITIFILNNSLKNDLNKINLTNYLVLKSKCECITDKVIINPFKDYYRIKIQQNNKLQIFEMQTNSTKTGQFEFIMTILLTNQLFANTNV